MRKRLNTVAFPYAPVKTNNMFKKLFVLMLLASSASYGQTVKGVVVDSLSGQSLPGASIQLLPSRQITVTDQFGQFRLKSFDTEQTLMVSYVGYTARTVKADQSPMTIRMQRSSVITEEVVVTATRSQEETPITATTVSRETLQKQNFGQDVPFLVNWTPSVVTTSDAGTGIGYTGIRIRGSDATRINVTINGIPYNDSESLGTFWVDIPDIASSSQSIQIQRGVGTSTNGAGAFGGSINLQTNIRNDQPYAEIINAFGSFDTRRHTFSFGTGVLQDRWLIEGRVSKIESEGFIDRGAADLSSYYFSAGYHTAKTIIKAITFGGKERTYQAWYGVPESRLNNDLEAMQITAANEGWNEVQTLNLLTSDSRTFNPYTYKNQVDDYQQDHFQFHFSHQLSDGLTWNTSLHYTPGRGYYEEYRYDANLEDYGITPPVIGDSVVTNADLVRRRWLDNDFYGATWSLLKEGVSTTLTWGGAWNRYDGDHFGEVIWAEVSPIEPGHRYYFNNGDKRDFNTFVKVNLMATGRLSLFGDLQFRGVSYRASGIESDQQSFNIDETFAFVNPKAGATYSLSGSQQLYASYAMGNREPVREDFLTADETPTHETLHNIEAGFRGHGRNHVLNINYYLMMYRNQLVLTGEINDVGAPVRTNAGESYRTGIEIESSLRLSDKLQLNANVTVSQNKIKTFTEALEDYGEDFTEYQIVTNTYEDTDISFSPNLIAGSQLAYLPHRNFEVALLSKYVGKQYLDNTSNDSRVIDGYFVNDLRLRYTIRPKFIREVVLSGLVNNLFNEQYESNGYTWGYLAGSTAYRENYFYPQAGINFMVMLSVKL
jgi:iron complex outermembrane recepter protein